MNELKPCPFCPDGGKPEIGYTVTYWGYCHTCGTEGPYKTTREEAIEAWNTRASLWIPANETVQEGQEAFVRVKFPGGPTVFYWATVENGVWSENFDDEIIPSGYVTHFHPIAEIPA